MEIFVHYEDHEVFGTVVPVRVMYRFTRNAIKWDEEFLFLPSTFEYVQTTADDPFPDDMVSVSLLRTDLISHSVHADEFGVYLPFVVDRIERQRKDYDLAVEYEQIEQIIISVVDIEAAMQKKITFLYDEEVF